MKRIYAVKTYLQKQDSHSKTKKNLLIYDQTIKQNSFAVCYYDKNRLIQKLKKIIEAEAKSKGKAKQLEIEDRNKKHRNLIQQISLITCNYKTQ